MPKVPSSQVVLDSAYRCFCRNGFRRTTISDIVEEARMSRPTVYKYAGTKDEAFAKVVRARLERASAAAEEAAAAAATPEEKVLGVLTVKLEVAVEIWRDSPTHAYELLSAASAHTPELVTAYTDCLTELVASALADVVPESAQQAAGVLLTFTRGLEDDLRDVEAARRDLRVGVQMITSGALSRPASLPA
ncbi:helix-turn-helix transcriptional regulator [Streptomyces sp. PKU-EA00015]|uniref:TetR/AcrR family transcriptional regulator n=1 Tax=Streptomyces sp. PKU-EA00015 TaxID=2748326 RepID=UPI0015A3E134|nr:TetR/AcrR family transcriptional regulator [Streptomyces sp. PKU-EA00015]NWF26709.1 helix-turn-helix transcriptional regulator [Streptomyces sp. PKU-EA00015]